MTSLALVKADETTMLARMEKARFLKALPAADKAVLAAAAIEYGYDPVMREITLYEGNLYITAMGHMNRAARHRDYAGLEVRPMNGEEREQYQMQAAPYAYIAKCYRKGFAVPSVGTGTADPHNPYRKNPIEVNHPEWMAESRAVRRAIRPYFPPKNPFAPLEEEDTIAVDTATGEIVESTARVLDALVPVPDDATPPADDWPDPDALEGEADPVSATRAAIKRKVVALGHNFDSFCTWFAGQSAYGNVPFEEANLDSLTACEEYVDGLAAKAQKKVGAA